MQKIIKYVFIILTVVIAFVAHAYPQFCCSDSNWQQEMLKEYNDPQTNTTNFSFPSGIFRNACSNCEYDPISNTVGCYCQDVSGLVSNFRSYFEMGRCQQIFDNRGGFLKCW